MGHGDHRVPIPREERAGPRRCQDSRRLRPGWQSAQDYDVRRQAQYPDWRSSPNERQGRPRLQHPVNSKHERLERPGESRHPRSSLFRLRLRRHARHDRRVSTRFRRLDLRLPRLPQQVGRQEQGRFHVHFDDLRQYLPHQARRLAHRTLHVWPGESIWLDARSLRQSLFRRLPQQATDDADSRALYGISPTSTTASASLPT